MANRPRNGETADGPASARSRELGRASRRLERVLESLDLDDEHELAEAVVAALRATERARRLESGSGPATPSTADADPDATGGVDSEPAGPLGPPGPGSDEER